MGKNFCNIEWKWCKYLKHSGVCAYCNSDTKTLNYCPRIKEIETVRLYDIIMSVEFDNVFPYIYKWYHDQERSRNGYEIVFNKLRSMAPKRHQLNDLYINIEKFEEDGREVSNVTGIDIIKNDGCHYAIEFVPWVDWVSMFITQETLNTMSYEEIVAGCLYEMTFFGFNEDEIKEEENKMVKSIEEFKREQLQ